MENKETRKLLLEEVAPHVPESILRALNEKFNVEDSADLQSRLSLFIDTLTPDYRTPLIGSEWSPLNDYSRFQNLELDPPTLDMTQMLQKNYVQQKVKIANGVHVVFRSRTAQDDSFLASWAHIEGEAYEKRTELEDKSKGEYLDAINAVTDSSRSLRELALFVVSIYGNGLTPDKDIYVTENGSRKISLDIVRRKREALMRLPSILVEDLLLHFHAFELRVAEMYGIKAIRAF